MRETAIAAARAAGALIRAHTGRVLNVDQHLGHDVKLELDRLCEKAIVDTIRAKFPHHAILAEEGGRYDGPEEYIWIIDPLDGTVNFFYGLPYYDTCVACYRRARGPAGDLPRGLATLGEPVVGVVYVPPLDELYVAAPDAGATRNGQPIHASAATQLTDALIATGFGNRPENIQRMKEVQAVLLAKVRKLRCLGAAGLDLANVACGRLTGFYERGLKPWDFAAARVILEESGARLTTHEYAPQEWDVLASAPGIHDELRALLGV